MAEGLEPVQHSIRKAQAGTHGVVITTHNRWAWAVEAIRSVLEQTLVPDQLIVVDDGSTDATVERIRDRFPGVHLIEQVNHGQSVACNVGIGELSTDYVSFLDDDDLWHPDKMRIIDYYLLHNPGCEAVNHSLWSFAGTAEPLEVRQSVELVADDINALIEAASTAPRTSDRTYLRIRGNSLALLMERNRGTLSGSTVRRATLLAAGLLRPELQNANDWSLFVSIARLTEWHHLDDRLTFSRQHGAQSSIEGGLVNAIGILAAFLPMWFGGRAGVGGGPAVNGEARALITYAGEYRSFVRNLFWIAMSRRRWSEARVIRQLARPLFVRRRDWISVFIPPAMVRLLGWVKARCR